MLQLNFKSLTSGILLSSFLVLSSISIARGQDFNSFPFNNTENLPKECYAPAKQDCSFYIDCLESSKQCVNTSYSYAVDYGDKYCRRFLGLVRVSEQTMQWRDQVMICLQRSLVPFLPGEQAQNATCNEVRSFAFNSHVDCYTRKEHQICSLPFWDIKQIFSTIDTQDLLTPESATQAVKVAKICLFRIDSYLGNSYGENFGGDLLSEFALETRNDLENKREFFASIIK